MKRKIKCYTMSALQQTEKSAAENCESGTITQQQNVTGTVLNNI